MTNLEKLEQAIYNALPRLKEIKDGCKIKVDDEIYTIGKGCNLYADYQIEINNICEFRFQDEYEVIGQEIALNDVLEWGLDCTKLNFDTPQMTYILAKWELSKPLLKEQSEELINYLTELI